MQRDQRENTVFAEIGRHLRATEGTTNGLEVLFEFLQEAVETATGGDGLERYVPIQEDGKATQRNAGALVIAAAIAYAGKEIADSQKALAEATQQLAAAVEESRERL